jgi:hypothetical protein
MLLENFYLNYRCSNCLGAWSLVWRERPAWKQGHWEHLDVTHEMADCARGNALSFPQLGITKVGQELPHPNSRCRSALDTSPSRYPYLPGDWGLVVSPEVPLRLRRSKRCETSFLPKRKSEQRSRLHCQDSALLAASPFLTARRMCSGIDSFAQRRRRRFQRRSRTCGPRHSG